MEPTSTVGSPPLFIKQPPLNKPEADGNKQQSSSPDSSLESLQPTAVQTEQVQQTVPTKPIQPAVPPEHVDPVEFLDPTADDEDGFARPPVGQIINSLIAEAKKHHSFSALFKLQALKNYLELLAKYHINPKITNPATHASLAITKSVGKGPYFARKIRQLAIYVDKFHTLPLTGSGKHHAHPSLLNNERVYQAVHQFLAVQENGEVSQFHNCREIN